jgi:cytidylate kinase
MMGQGYSKMTNQEQIGSSLVETLTIFSSHLWACLELVSSISSWNSIVTDNGNTTTLIGNEGGGEARQLNLMRRIFLEEVRREFPSLDFRPKWGDVLHDTAVILPNHYWLVSSNDVQIIVDPWGKTQLTRLDVLSQADLACLYYQERELDLAIISEVQNENLQYWSRQLQMLKTKWWYRKFLHQMNIYLVGGCLTGKRTTMQYLYNTLGLLALDSSILFRIITYRLFYEQTSYPIAPDFSLLSNSVNAPKEVVRLKSAIEKRLGYIRKCLSETDLTHAIEETKRTLNGNPNLPEYYYSSGVNDLVLIVAEIPAVQFLVKKRIEEFLMHNSGVVVTGYSYREIDPAIFTTINLIIDDISAARRLVLKEESLSIEDAVQVVHSRNIQNDVPQTIRLTKSLSQAITVDVSSSTPVQIGRSILRHLITTTQRNSIEYDEQKNHQILREVFCWPSNPFIEKLRADGNNIVQDVMQKYIPFGVSPMDISIQAAIHLAAYPVAKVWQGDSLAIATIAEMIADQSPNLRTLSDDFFSSSKIYLNKEVFQSEVYRQAQRITDLHQALARECEFDLLGVVKRMGIGAESGLYRNGIDIPVRGQLTLDSKRLYHDGVVCWIGSEKKSGRVIIFRPISADISRIYMKAFHYLHEERDDEVAAFGAFLDGDQFPFALVSYSPINREYKQTMLSYVGLEPSACLEFTRGWNSPWAPKNTMSCLFSYAHQRLKEHSEQQFNSYKIATNLKGILTSINPNLGFKAHAFRGVKYIPLGLKPAKFTYLRDEKGILNYCSRRGIQKHLPLSEQENFKHSPMFQSSCIPMAPSVEMIILMNKTDHDAILKRPLYVVPPHKY